MNELQIFTNEEFGQVRVVEQNGEPWFVAKDVCDILGTDTRDIPGILDADEQRPIVDTIHTLNDNNGLRKDSRIISEPGLYSLVIRSRKPEAKAFKRWITHDVLPTIRKHGAYLTPATIEKVLDDPDTIIRLATTLKEERARRAALEAQAEADRPKVVFADSIEVSKSSILVGELAKLITQSTGYVIGQTRMFKWLRENEYLHQKEGSQYNMPTQRSIERGWFKIKEGTRIGSSGECHITKTSKVTGKGQIYFVNLFKAMTEEQAV